MGKRYFRFEVMLQTPFAREVSKFMNACDFDGEYGITTDIVSFSSTSDKTIDYLRDALKESYGKSGAKVFEITGGEWSTPTPAKPKEETTE